MTSFPLLSAEWSNKYRVSQSCNAGTEGMHQNLNPSATQFSYTGIPTFQSSNKIDYSLAKKQSILCVVCFLINVECH